MVGSWVARCGQFVAVAWYVVLSQADGPAALGVVKVVLCRGVSHRFWSTHCDLPGLNGSGRRTACLFSRRFAAPTGHQTNIKDRRRSPTVREAETHLWRPLQRKNSLDGDRKLILAELSRSGRDDSDGASLPLCLCEFASPPSELSTQCHYRMHSATLFEVLVIRYWRPLPQRQVGD